MGAGSDQVMTSGGRVRVSSLITRQREKRNDVACMNMIVPV